MHGRGSSEGEAQGEGEGGRRVRSERRKNFGRWRFGEVRNHCRSQLTWVVWVHLVSTMSPADLESVRGARERGCRFSDHLFDACNHWDICLEVLSGVLNVLGVFSLILRFCGVNHSCLHLSKLEAVDETISAYPRRMAKSLTRGARPDPGLSPSEFFRGALLFPFMSCHVF